MTATLVWLLIAGPAWSLVGALALPRRYRARGLDPRLAPLVGGVVGAATGPLGVGLLYILLPELRRGRHVALPSLLLAAELAALFRASFPSNVCVTSPSYVLDQVQNGLTLGMVYATIAVGLTLVFSVQGIVSFAHGQFFLLGGVLSFLLLTHVWDANPVYAIPVAGAVTLVVGMAFERGMLGPIHGARVERPAEYAILVTFGFGMFLQYALVGLMGSPRGVKSPRYTERPILGIDDPTLAIGSIRVRTDLLIAGLIGLLLILCLHWFLRRTWMGMSLRAVAMDRDAAAAVGIDTGRAFTAAFGIGSMLAGMSGAALVPALTFPVPQMASQAALRSYVVIVLGGLGSVPGALLGGLFVGAVEALGAGCYPDPSRGAVYQPAFSLLIFALVLLVRPRGFFGRKG
ncbi:MAG TPA: branched-chain amino acid ABC transporter permease [Actinomycetota bacterium]|nr:branched-chain amino acid ABC transporter permease [Actinomycetota bacterium]